MIITRNPDALDLPLPLDLSQGTSVTVGNFDGVHLGHQALLAMTCERAAATGTLPVAMTFNPHPLEVLTPYAPPRLTTPQARLALLEASGMALVMLVVFTSEFAAMSPETFVRRILLGTLNMRELLLGYDFTLGKGRAGTPEVLAQLGKDGYEARVLADGQLGLACGVEIRAELAEDAGGDGPGLGLSGGAERGRHPAALVVLDQLAGELLLHALALFAAGQKQVAFHLHQPRGHLDEGAGGFRVRVGPRHRGGVLVDQLQNGDVVQVHLMFGHKRQQ